jgi:hypothetical protein
MSVSRSNFVSFWLVAIARHLWARQCIRGRDLGALFAALDSGQKVVALAHRFLPCMNSMRSISASTNFCASTGAPLRMSEAASSLTASIFAASVGQGVGFGRRAYRNAQTLCCTARLVS